MCTGNIASLMTAPLKARKNLFNNSPQPNVTGTLDVDAAPPIASPNTTGLQIAQDQPTSLRGVFGA